MEPKPSSNLWPRLFVYGLFGLLLFSQVQLRAGPIVFYPPELLIYPALLGLWLRPNSRNQLITAYRSLSLELRVALGLFLVGAIIGTVVSPLWPTSIGAFKAWVISPLVVGWIFTGFYRNREEVIIEGMTIFGLLVGLLTYFQLFQSGDLIRATAYFNSPNTLAAIVGPITVLTFWQGYRTGRKRWFIFSLFLLGSLLLSRSLGGLIGLGGSLLFAFRYLTVRWKYFVAALLILGTIGSFTILHGRTEGSENSLSGREQIWTAGIYLIKAWPITGAGLRGFEYHYPHIIGGLVEHPQEWAAVPQPHNIVLAVWLGTGLFGIIGLLGLLYYLVIWRGVPTAAHLAMLAVLFHGLIDTPYWRVDLNILFWVYLVVIWLARPSPMETDGQA